jgi:predicted porin
MKTRTLTKTLLAVGIASAVFTTQAAELRVNGFASVVGGKTISDDKVASNPYAAPGVFDEKSRYEVTPVFSGDDSAFYDDDVSFKPETNIGLQLSADLGDGLSVVAQLTAQGANDFDAEIEWLYISYDLSNQLNAKAGRQRIPFYAYSDYLDVGYAYHWIRPPQDVYNLEASSYEGVSLTYNFSLGDWDTSLMGYIGANDNNTSSLGTLDTEQNIGLVLTGTYDWLELRVAYHEAVLEIPDLFGDGSDGRPFSEGNEETFEYASFGAKMNFTSVFIGFEYTSSSFSETPVFPFDTGTEGTDSWYITTGYRLGAWTPHLTFSSAENDYETVDFGGDGLSPDYRDGHTVSRETWTLGVRYDFHPSAALKIEYTDSSDESDSDITTVAGKPGEVSTFAVGVDVIF